MRVELRQSVAGRRWAKLRPLTGEDEVSLDLADAGAANALLARLLDGSGVTVGPECLMALSVTDRDRLLAAIYRMEFGDRIVGVATCSNCREEFEFDFSLDALLTHQDHGSEQAVREGDGFYRLADGCRFRAPTLGDMEEVAKLPIDTAIRALLDRCLEAPAAERSRDAVQAALEQVAPILNIDVESQCPHCESTQGVAFSLESYLLRVLAQERRFLTHEIHRLALSYGWSLRDILSLSRGDRRSLVRRVEAEWAASSGSGSLG
mgnify:CR=1 FL=1